MMPSYRSQPLRMSRSSSGNPAQGWGWSYVIPRTPQPQKAADPESGRPLIRAQRGSASANGLRIGFRMVRGVAGKRANVPGEIAASRWPDSAICQRSVAGSTPGRGFGVSGRWPSAAETPLPRLPRSSAMDKWNVPRWPRPAGAQAGRRLPSSPHARHPCGSAQAAAIRGSDGPLRSHAVVWAELASQGWGVATSLSTKS